MHLPRGNAPRPAVSWFRQWVQEVELDSCGPVSDEEHAGASLVSQRKLQG